MRKKFLWNEETGHWGIFIVMIGYILMLVIGIVAGFLFGFSKGYLAGYF